MRTSKSGATASHQRAATPAITGIKVGGYKLFDETREIRLGKLSVLAGANSSGKSSLLQPLLLLKQTLESAESGASIVLTGPNVMFTDKDQLLTSRKTASSDERHLIIGLSLDDGESELEHRYSAVNGKPLTLIRASALESKVTLDLSPGMASDEISQRLPEAINRALETSFGPVIYTVGLERGFVNLRLKKKLEEGELNLDLGISSRFERAVRHIIHVPGLRISPRRKFSMISSPGLPWFPETMDSYVAWLLSEWDAHDSSKLQNLTNSLGRLGLTSEIETKEVDELTVDILVASNLAENSVKVSIADVGFGVSQVLPVLMALIAAEPNQLVYIEQPEVHLHPKAQVELAKIICESIERGVRVVIETHSELMLLTIQAYVASGRLDPAETKLLWFSRGPGSSQVDIREAELGRDGSFGDWPEDFSATSIGAQMDYLNSIGSSDS